MADYTPDEGELKMLQSIMAVENMTLRLYTNNHTPASDDDTSDYTACSGGGYADKTLSSGSWTVSTVSNVATATYAAQTFTFTGTITSPPIYGVIIFGATSGKIYRVIPLASSWYPEYSGDNLIVTLTITLQTA